MKHLAVWRLLSCLLACSLLAQIASARPKPRARDLGIPFDGTPGPVNAITDVKGVEVGLVTLISGEGKKQVGVGPIRTGVTAILPRGKQDDNPVFAGWFTLNGNGEMTGTTWIEEHGVMSGPVMITNTHSVGTVRDAVIAYQIKKFHLDTWSLPVVAETYDGYLNDVNGFHVKEGHVFEALDKANSGPVAEGNVGGGTGMICHGFKGGTGTASRKTDDGYTVGVLVQANHGARKRLTIAGAPVGVELGERAARIDVPTQSKSSIIIVIATDAPLLPHQLKGLAKRASLGAGRVGGLGEVSSGDIFIAFSTANSNILPSKPTPTIPLIAIPVSRSLNGLYAAVVAATEESIINALVAAETMTGVDDHKVGALPHDRLRAILKRHNRLIEPKAP
jgi:D-aminopeptidase